MRGYPNARYWDTLRNHANDVGNGWSETVASGSYLVTRVAPDMPRTTWLHVPWRSHFR